MFPSLRELNIHLPTVFVWTKKATCTRVPNHSHIHIVYMIVSRWKAENKYCHSLLLTNYIILHNYICPVTVTPPSQKGRERDCLWHDLDGRVCLQIWFVKFKPDLYLYICTHDLTCAIYVVHFGIAQYSDVGIEAINPWDFPLTKFNMHFHCHYFFTTFSLSALSQVETQYCWSQSQSQIPSRFQRLQADSFALQIGVGFDLTIP